MFCCFLALQIVSHRKYCESAHGLSPLMEILHEFKCSILLLNIFTPREMFTYELIITLIILMLSQLIPQIFCISFAAISIAVIRLGATLRHDGSSPLITVDTSMVEISPTVLFLYLIIE